MITADTITDEQIRELLASIPEDANLHSVNGQRRRMCHVALGEHEHVVVDRCEARARCAEILNERAGGGGAVKLTDDAIRQLRTEALAGDDETTLCLCEAALLRSETASVHGVTRAEARQLLAERLGVEVAS